MIRNETYDTYDTYDTNDTNNTNATKCSLMMPLTATAATPQVDDKIPCSHGRSPLFCKSKNGHELWMSVVEKAYAKHAGSYEVIEGGQIHVGLAALTGGE